MAYKQTSIADLRKMNGEGLEKEAAKAKAELAKNILHVRVGEDKKSHTISSLRRYIARINTVKLEIPTNA